MLKRAGTQEKNKGSGTKLKEVSPPLINNRGHLLAAWPHHVTEILQDFASVAGIGGKHQYGENCFRECMGKHFFSYGTLFKIGLPFYFDISFGTEEENTSLCLWGFSLPFSNDHASTYTLLSNDVCLIGAYGREERKDVFSWCPYFMLWTWKYLNTPPKSVWRWLWHLYTVSRSSLRSCPWSPCQLAITDTTIAHPQVQPYNTTLIETGIVYERETALNACLIHRNACVWILLSSPIIPMSMLPYFLERRLALGAFSWEFLITRLNLHGEI